MLSPPLAQLLGGTSFRDVRHSGRLAIPTRLVAAYRSIFQLLSCDLVGVLAPGIFQIRQISISPKLGVSISDYQE
jgi:hypothetical protein